MKKLFFIALLAVSSTTFAQHFSAGIKAGANLSNFTGGNFENVKKKIKGGFYAGGFLNFGLGSNFSIQPEALISTQGVTIDSLSGSSPNYDWKLTYLQIPVMFKFKSAGGFYVEAGPQVGFKLSSDVPNQTIKDFAKGLDLSLGGGIGYQSSSGFGIGARYLAGLSKVGDFNPSTGVDPDFKNSVIQLGISFALGGSGK